MAIDSFTPASNIVAYSDDMTSATGWTKTATMADYTNSAGGTPPASIYNVSKSFRGTLSAGNTIFLINAARGAYVVDSTVYRISIFIKQGSGIQWVGFGVTGSGTYYCPFDIINGVVGTPVSVSNPTITSVGNNWYKLTVEYTGNTAGMDYGIRIHLSPRTNSSGGTFTAAGGEYVYFSSPSAQPIIDSSDEYKKYIPTVTHVQTWGPPRPYPDVWGQTAEGTFGVTTMGGYLERIKKYVANKMTKSGSTYTIYKDDETTVYQTGVTTGSTRDPV